MSARSLRPAVRSKSNQPRNSGAKSRQKTRCCNAVRILASRDPDHHDSVYPRSQEGFQGSSPAKSKRRTRRPLYARQDKREKPVTLQFILLLVYLNVRYPLTAQPVLVEKYI